MKSLISILLFCVFLPTQAKSQDNGYISFSVLQNGLYGDFVEVKSAFLQDGWLWGSGSDSTVTLYYPEIGVSNWKESSNTCIIKFRDSLGDNMLAYRLIKSISYFTFNDNAVAAYAKAIRESGYTFLADNSNDIVSLTAYRKGHELLQASEMYIPQKGKHCHGWTIVK